MDQASLGAGLDVRLPYFSNDKSITITDFNSTNNDYVTTLPQGHFIRRISKETTPQNVSYLPKDIWQTNNLGPRSDGTFHYDFAGYYPYEYNKSKSTWILTNCISPKMANFRHGGPIRTLEAPVGPILKFSQHGQLFHRNNMYLSASKAKNLKN